MALLQPHQLSRVAIPYKGTLHSPTVSISLCGGVPRCGLGQGLTQRRSCSSDTAAKAKLCRVEQASDGGFYTLDEAKARKAEYQECMGGKAGGLPVSERRPRARASARIWRWRSVTSLGHCATGTWRKQSCVTQYGAVSVDERCPLSSHVSSAT